MGRTALPYSHLLQAERARWKPFRRLLGKGDREAFDRLFDRAKFHTHAGVYMAHPWPMKTILLSIVLEHGKILESILAKLQEKEGPKVSSRS